MQKNTTCRSPGRKTLLAVAVAATLLNGAASAAPGDRIISSDEENVVWSADSLTVNPDVKVSSPSTGDAVLVNGGSRVGTLTNSGRIESLDGTAINNNGDMSLVNHGVIIGKRGVYNTGTIGTLNNSGTIIGSGDVNGNGIAIYNNGVLRGIGNSGTIAGDITDDSGNDLVIYGGSGSIFGVLTGASAGLSADDIGTITSQSNLKFFSGNLLLNDDITVGSLASVQNSGATLQINNDIEIQGNYAQSAGASLLFGVADVASATGDPQIDVGGYGRLLVNGRVTLESGTTVGLSKTGSAYTFAQGQRYMVIRVQDGAHSNFNESTLNYSLNASGLTLNGENVAITGEPGANALVLTVVAKNGASNAINMATTGDARSSLNGLFNYQGTDSQLMDLQRAGAALGTSGAANNGGAQLSPASSASAAAVASTGASQKVFEVVGNHLDALRTAQVGNGASGIATGEAGSTGGGLWGQAFGGSSRQDERDDIAGYHANYHGMLLGADAELNDSWRAGGLFSYSSTSVNNDGANKHNSADIDSYGLIGYATYTANPWYLNLSAGAVQHQYDSKRQISLIGFEGTARGDYDGMQYLAAVQAGYPIDLGSKTTLTPIAGLNYSTLKLDSYTEKGGNGAALHVQSDDIDSLKSELGAKLERSFATSYGELIPSAQLTWRHEFRDEGLRSVANFSADVAGETSFASNGPSAIGDTGVLSLGATLVRSERLSLSAKYTLEAGSGYTANTGNLQVRWNF